MLTLKDCMGICELSEDEIAAIALHEHIPDIVAAEVGQYIIRSKDGVPHLKKIILEDIEQAKSRGQQAQVEKLEQVLRHFVLTHPEHAQHTQGS